MPVTDRIVNVTGFDNGCGAHTILHAFEDNFATIDWSRPGCQNLLQTFSDVYGVDATPENFQKALAAIPGYASKEYAFGPIVRKHMAEMIQLDGYYKQELSEQFVHVVRAYLMNDTREATNLNLRCGNETFMAELKQHFQSSRIDLDTYIAQHQRAILQYYNETGFDNYIRVLGDTAHALMFTADEIHTYARVMGFHLEIDGRDGFHLEHPVSERDRLFKLRLSNVGIHWRYWADNLSPETVQQRNQDTYIAPIDRDPLLRNMSENGWQPYLQPLINRVQRACRDEALEGDFLSQPSYTYTSFDQNDRLLTWIRDEKFMRANDYLNRELDRGIELDPEQFNTRFEQLSDSVCNGTLDEIEQLQRNSIKAKS